MPRDPLVVLARQGLRIIRRGGEHVVCCNVEQDWQPGGLMGRPFFTVFCEKCLTLFVDSSTAKELASFVRNERRVREDPR